MKGRRERGEEIEGEVGRGKEGASKGGKKGSEGNINIVVVEKINIYIPPQL